MRTTALAALLIGLTITTPAAAEEQSWEIGSAFLIRGTGLDLDTADGRERLLQRVERASAKICRGEYPLVARERCAQEAQAKAMASASPRLRQAVEVAMSTRNAAMLAAAKGLVRRAAGQRGRPPNSKIQQIQSLP